MFQSWHDFLLHARNTPAYVPLLLLHLAINGALDGI